MYHGRTLTSRILFRDVMEAISKYAFVSSPYPVIISFEIHCCAEQQRAIAFILKDVLKEKLLYHPVGSTGKLPLLSELMEKIIVKVFEHS